MMTDLLHSVRAGFTANSFPSNTFPGSSVSALSNGGFVSFWTNDSTGGAVQRYDAAGNPVGSAVAIPTATNEPTITSLGNGGFVAAWLGFNNNGFDGDIHAQVFNANGAAAGLPFLVNSTTTGDQAEPTIANLSGGGFVVAWTDATGTGGALDFEIKAQMFGASGTKVGGEFLVNTTTADWQSAAKVTGLDNGGFVVTWSDYSGQGGDSDHSIKGQIYSASGIAVGTEFLANTTVAHDQINPQITALAGGGFLISWETYTFNATTQQQAQIFAADGTKVGSEIEGRSGDTASDQNFITRLPDGGFVLGWDDFGDRNDPNATLRVRAQQYDSTGHIVGAEFTVGAAADQNTTIGQLSATTTTGGEIVVSWGEEFFDRNSNSHDLVKTAVLGTGAAAVTDIALNLTPHQTLEHAVAGTVIGALVASDSDINDVEHFSIVNDPTHGGYGIVGDSLVIADSAKFDYAMTPGAGVTVRATGADGLIFDKLITLPHADAILGYSVEKVGAEITATSGNTADVAPLANGGFVLTWGDFNGSLGDPDANIQAQIFAANGTAQGSEFRVNSATALYQYDPSIASLADGRFAIAWTDQSGDSSGAAIKAQIYAANGTTVGGELLVNTVTAGAQTTESITGLENGNFVVTWTDESIYTGHAPYENLLKAQIFDHDGNRVGSEFRLNSAAATSATDSSITALANGGFVVSWTAGLPGEAGLNVYARAYTSAGAALGNEFRVNTTAAYDQNSATSYDKTQSDVCALDNGRYVVVWKDQTLIPNSHSFGSNLTAQIFDADGSRVGTEFSVSTLPSYGQISPSITATANGGFSVSWTDEIDIDSGIGNDFDGRAIVAQLFDATGTRLGSEISVNTQVVGNQSQSALATLADGDVVASWIDRVSGQVAKAQVLHLSGPPIDSDGGGAGASVAVAENVAAVTTVHAARPEISAPIDYSIVGGADAARFVIDAHSGAVQFASAPDFEAPTDIGQDNVYNVVVRASASLGHSDQALSVSVQDISEVTTQTGVVVDGYISGASVFLDANNNGVLDAGEASTLSGVDGSFTLPIGAGTIRATGGTNIDSGKPNQLELAAPAGSAVLSPLTTLVQSIVASGTDSATAQAQVKAAFGIAPAVALLSFDPLAAAAGNADALTVQRAATSVVAVLTAIGTAAPANGANAAEAAGLSSLAALTSSAATGGTLVDLTSPAQLNTVVAASLPGVSPDTLAAIVISTQAETSAIANATSVGDITAVQANHAPVITSYAGADSATVALAENSLAVSTIAASDSDANTHLAYAIAGGTDAALFDIDGATGQLRYKAAPNFESPADFDHNNIYNVIVQVSDGTLIDTQAIAATVTNVNEAPAITSNGGGSNATFAIVENTTAGTLVSASDPDAATTLSFSVVGGDDAARFTIDSTSGALAFASAPNFELPTDLDHNNIYDVIVRATDGTLFDDQAIAITVLNNPNETFSGTSGNDVIAGTGDDDVLVGLAGNDTLNGGAGNDVLNGDEGDDFLDGGRGADMMYGGLGNDTYVVDDIGDRAIETTPSGIDRVLSSVDFTLGANIEVLTLTGSDNVNGTGNALANRIVGNAGNNVLDSGAGNDTIDGGGGNDTLIGGIGQDIYVIDHIGAVVVEQANGGTDTVKASISYALTDNVERLFLTGLTAIDGTGNAMNNIINGNSAANILNGGTGNDTLSAFGGTDTLIGGDGNDRLNGGDAADVLSGGLGRDVLIGGAGTDTFVFDTLTATAQPDTVTDFVSGADHIAISKAIFTAFASDPLGALSSSEFHIGPRATGLDQHIIYNSATGALFFDPDGMGGTAQIQIAALTGHPTLSVGDLFLF